tara:strand:- start:81 stop:278 length:198 start_codon:yes stop_codon:yes gene_type:complete
MKPTEAGMYLSDWSKTGAFTFSEFNGDVENTISLEVPMHLLKQLQEKINQEVEEFETKQLEKENV